MTFKIYTTSLENVPALVDYPNMVVATYRTYHKRRDIF